MTVIAVCNQKGGVGKTTLTANLADVWSRRGLRVLLVDADQQANLTAAVGLAEDPPPFTLNDVLAGGAGGEVTPGVLTEAVHKAGDGWHGVEVVASTLELGNREQDQMLGREARLRTAMTGTRDLWDLVLIDCPPHLGQLTVNALVAADQALLVTEPRALAVDGLAQMVRTCATVQRNYNPALRLAGIVVNKHSERRVDAAEWVAQLGESYPGLVLDPFIADREIVAKATSAALPVSAFEHSHPAAVVVGSQLAAIARAILKENTPS